MAMADVVEGGGVCWSGGGLQRGLRGRRYADDAQLLRDAAGRFAQMAAVARQDPPAGSVGAQEARHRRVIADLLQDLADFTLAEHASPDRSELLVPLARALLGQS